MAPDPEVILEFWFAGAAGDAVDALARNVFWFGTNPDADAIVRARFGPVIDAAAAGALAGWLSGPRSALALVIVFDQFPRNAFRGTARAFAHDARALETARQAVAAGYLAALAPIEGAFLILPYAHDESVESQRESVRLSRQLVRDAPQPWRALLEEYLAFAEQHAALIERFGRFPHRNRVLGRASTALEEEYLSSGGATFGQK